ncbi:MAG: tRNA 5-methoxyuridine(34)/uridine 5-oxyacetic acid(34) synthase CmoB [Porticoccaceae bacterium]
MDYTHLLAALDQSGSARLAEWAQELPAIINKQISARRWGDLPDWLEALRQLPDIDPISVELEHSVTIGDPGLFDKARRETLAKTLMTLHPWRKGPFTLFGIDIETEWRSDWKWQRLIDQIQPLQGRRVLDIGCGSGYHCLRMYGAGAAQVIGIDPAVKFVCQFYALKHFLTPQLPVDVLPLGIEQLPTESRSFDTVFSMGILYHRRSPMDHLRELRAQLRSGGQLVLETLVIDGELGATLVPEGRYAKMPNVWFIPSVATLISWLQKCGFKEVYCIDQSTTSHQEQRSTQWMQFESLSDFLDPNDSSKTVEGHPAPLRAVITATAP